MGKIKTLLGCVCLLFVGLTLSHASPVVEPSSKDVLREKVSVTYLSQVGVKETLGANDGKEIRAYLKVTGFKQPVPWCAAFVSYCLTSNGIDNPKTAWSPAWFADARKLVDPVKLKPEKADVFGVYFASHRRIAHVGFIHSWPPGDYFISVEGNTNDNGSREGDGVYKKRRIKRNAYKISRWI
jgi:hypothetical protein